METFLTIIYEPFNEPNYTTIGGSTLLTWDDIRPYHAEIVKTIRSLGAENLIVCGTAIWSQALWEVPGKEINDDNVAYTLHFYSSSPEHQAPLRNAAQGALNNNLAIFVTEYGITEFDGNGGIDVSQAEIWWDFLDESKISWCNWSIANKDETSAAFNFVQAWQFRTEPLTAQELNGLTLSQSGTLVKQQLEKNN